MILRWNRFVFYSLLCCSVLSCATTLWINVEKRRVGKINVFLLFLTWLTISMLLLCLTFGCIQTMTRDRLYETNPVALYANYAVMLSRYGLYYVYVWTLRGRDRKLKLWLEDIFLLQGQYFDYFETVCRERNSTRWWLYFNSTLAVVHSFETSWDIYGNIYEEEGYGTLILYPLSATIFLQHFCMLHHGLLLGWLEEYFVMINQQIEQKSFKPQ